MSTEQFGTDDLKHERIKHIVTDTHKTRLKQLCQKVIDNRVPKVCSIHHANPFATRRLCTVFPLRVRENYIRWSTPVAHANAHNAKSVSLARAAFWGDIHSLRSIRLASQLLTYATWK